MKTTTTTGTIPLKLLSDPAAKQQQLMGLWSCYTEKDGSDGGAWKVGGDISFQIERDLSRIMLLNWGLNGFVAPWIEKKQRNRTLLWHNLFLVQKKWIS